MIDLLDLRAHTIASSHAYNSLYEMVYSISVKGLSLFGYSDHAPAMPGSCHSSHFIDFRVLPRTLYGVRLMMGVELDITDCGGIVDLEQNILESPDYAVASLHQPYIHSGTVLQNTSAYLGTLKNPLIHVVGHPNDSRFPIDYDMLVAAVGEHHELLEVDNSSLSPLNFRVGTRDNCIKIPELCRHYGTNIIVNSDAHCETDTDNHGFAHALLEEVDFPQELVINMSLDRLCGFLLEATAALAQQEGERRGHPYQSGAIQEETVQERDASGGDKS